MIMLVSCLSQQLGRDNLQSIYLKLNDLEHDLNRISNNEEQIIQDVAHRLTLRRGDYIFDVTQGLDYDIVFGKGYHTEQKVAHIQSVILQNTNISDAIIIRFDEMKSTRTLELEYELILEETRRILKGGVEIGA